jgi:hypothetical protein
MGLHGGCFRFFVFRRPEHVSNNHSEGRLKAFMPVFSTLDFAASSREKHG